MGIQILVPLGQEKVVLYSEIAGAIIDLLLNFLLIPSMASSGAAIGTLAAEFIVFLVQFIFLQKDIINAYRQIRYTTILCAMLVSTIIVIGIKRLALGNFCSLLLSAFLSFGIYAIILSICKEPLVWEIEQQLLKKFNIRK